ncbi:MAG: hypothetical protein WBI74_10445 [Caldicoprobacterales bacterium]
MAQEPGERETISIWVPIGRFSPEDRRDKIDHDKDYGYIEDKFNIGRRIPQIHRTYHQQS